MPITRIPDDDAAQMRAEYEGPGKPSVEKMSARWGWSDDAIRAAILRAGGKLRQPGHKPKILLPVPDRMVLSLRDFGMTRKQIAQRFDITPQQVSHVMARARRAEKRA